MLFETLKIEFLVLFETLKTEFVVLFETLQWLQNHNVTHVNSRANLVGQVERITPRNSIYCYIIKMIIVTQEYSELVDGMSRFVVV